GLGEVGGVGSGPGSVGPLLAAHPVTTRRATPMVTASKAGPRRLGLGCGGVGLVPHWGLGSCPGASWWWVGGATGQVGGWLPEGGGGGGDIGVWLLCRGGPRGE